ncbi:hypothetical protein ES703_17900 [subsurface metagenome]
MATIKILQPREQAAHFGLYRTSAGGDQEIFVRRKIADPTDYMHTKSRKLKKQRANLTLASQHYSRLTPSQKAITRHQIEEVEVIKSHGKSDLKLLSGRQLFISKEMHNLETAGKPLYLPHELCIMLVDENLSPLAGKLELRYLDLGEWWNIYGDEIWTGNWLYSLVPRAMDAYRPYGEAEGYFDPMLPEHQAMTEDEIRAYHYHKLLLPVNYEYIYPNGDGSITELLTTGEPHWQMVLVEDTIFIPPDGGGGFGRFEGNYVWNKWWPQEDAADLYTFTNPLYAVQHIYKLTAYLKIARNLYPYGDWKVILKTHGVVYYTDWIGEWHLDEFSPVEFAVNPYTNKEWTRDEVNSLQLGVFFHVPTMWTVWMCDCIKIKLDYL